MSKHDFTQNDTKDADAKGAAGARPSGPSAQTTAAARSLNALLRQAASQGAPSGQDDDDIPDCLTDMNARHKDDDPVMHRDVETARIMAVLMGSMKPNPMLIGPAGCGKTRIVEDIARRLATDDGVPSVLKGHVIYELSLTALVSHGGIVGSLERELNAVVDFACNPDNKAVLFIDEIHMLAAARGQNPEMARIAQILKPALSRGDLHVIGATTMTESRSFDNDPALSRRFTRVIVDELSPCATAEILEATLPRLTAHYANEVRVPAGLVTDIVSEADALVRASGSHRPDNALTLADRAMAMAAIDRAKDIARLTAQGTDVSDLAAQTLQALPTTLTPGLVHAAAIALMTGGGSSDAAGAGKLAEDMDAGIIGQTDAKRRIVDICRRWELGAFPRTRPLTLLFAGASGCGKTQSAKIIARDMTGVDPVFLNMAEYSEPMSATRILGSSAGYVGSDSNRELPFDCLRANPRRVIVLDEMEKACADVQRLFLAAFDEGTFTEASGCVIDFSQAIVIMTTNAAREDLSHRRAGFGESTPDMSTASLVLALQKSFDAELLGRVDAIMGFAPMTRATYREVLKAQCREARASLTARVAYLASGIPDEPDDETLERIVERTYLPDQGARPARTAAREWLEDIILEQSARREHRRAANGGGDGDGTDDGTDADKADGTAVATTADTNDIAENGHAATAHAAD